MEGPLPYIDTLPGGTNLSEIADIEYIQKKLVTALRVPKAYLGFEEPVGDGKNLSLLDIRFARTINRIQKSAIAEMNKIAIIHLFLMGFEDELSNFTLQLTNPSKQADLLMIDVWATKITLYKDMVAEIPKSIQPVSATWAKKHIFGFSDDEIKNELLQIRMERAVSAELDNTATIVTRTGIFDTVDRLYKPVTGTTLSAGGAPGADAGGAPPPPDAGAPPPPDAGAPLPESIRKDKNKLILESNEDDFNEDEFLDFKKINNSLGDLEDQLSKLLGD